MVAAAQEEQTVPDGAADLLADVRARHRPTWTVTGPKRKVCAWANCHGEWPCETARALAALDAERAENERLRADLDVEKNAQSAEVQAWADQHRATRLRAEAAEAAITRASEYLRGVGESSLAHLHLAGHGEAVKAINSAVAALETGYRTG